MTQGVETTTAPLPLTMQIFNHFSDLPLATRGTLAQGWCKLFLCALAGGLLSACANPMLRQARQDCDPESHQLFPVVLQSQRVTEPVVVQVPDGTQHCITETVRQGDRTTAVSRCVPNFIVQTRWIDRWVNVDLNARERSIWHERCVQQLCVQRAGNTACESTPGPSSVMPAPAHMLPSAPATTP